MRIPRGTIGGRPRFLFFPGFPLHSICLLRHHIRLTPPRFHGVVAPNGTLAHRAASTPPELLASTTDLHDYNTRSTGMPGPRTEAGKLYASDRPGLGVEPDVASLGDPVAVYGVAS